MPRPPRRLVLLPAILTAACAGAPPPPVAGVAARDPFTVDYRGEVVHAQLGAEPAPSLAQAPRDAARAEDPAPSAVARPLTPRVRTRLVTVHARLVAMPTLLAQQLVPDLFRAARDQDGGATRPPKDAGVRTGFGSLPRDVGGVVAATTRGVHVDGDTFAAALATLLADARATELDGPQVVCAEGATATVTTTDEQSLVQGLDLRPTGDGRFVSVLQVVPVQHGVWLEVAPHRTAPDQLELVLDLQWRELVRPVPEVTTRFGIVHLPTVVVQRLHSRMPVGRRDTLVLGAMSGPPTHDVVVAVVQVTADDPGTSSLTQ
jgi:hypothetical protein